MVRSSGKGKAQGPLPQISRKTDLQVTSLSAQAIILVKGVLSASEAKAVVAAAERIGFEHQGSKGPANGEAVRDNGRIALSDKAYAEHLWQALGLQPALAGIMVEGAQACGLNPNIRIYRYEPGQRFNRHYDDSADMGDGLKTAYTLLVYLSGQEHGMQGGETVFYSHGKRSKTVASVTPETGLALLHRHGDDCLLHEGRPVLAGTKYVLRSDVIFGPTAA
ncbi:g8270 [Coccomyxa viridis]|uniref:G8270 protein n=1 Tax=Coccomyxa viridis TaxID=1274662 RepID=A0ABP1FZX9_9CHLO